MTALCKAIVMLPRMHIKDQKYQLLIRNSNIYLNHGHEDLSNSNLCRLGCFNVAERSQKGFTMFQKSFCDCHNFFYFTIYCQLLRNLRRDCNQIKSNIVLNFSNSNTSNQQMHEYSILTLIDTHHTLFGSHLMDNLSNPEQRMGLKHFRMLMWGRLLTGRVHDWTICISKGGLRFENVASLNKNIPSS